MMPSARTHRLAAIAAALLLLVTMVALSRDFGDAINNPKDVPFAAMAVLGITMPLDWAQGFDVLFVGQNLGAGLLPSTYVPAFLSVSDRLTLKTP